MAAQSSGYAPKLHGVKAESQVLQVSAFKVQSDHGYKSLNDIHDTPPSVSDLKLTPMTGKAFAQERAMPLPSQQCSKC
jgi:hypothetical protein